MRSCRQGVAGPLVATLVAVVALALVPTQAGAFRLARVLGPVSGNPADRLAYRLPDEEHYDGATRCLSQPRPGTVALTRWLQRHAKGVFWGSYRCERWGKGEASLHAEGRAIDWHLDVGRPAERKEARRLIELLLAPDKVGTPRALARRMGIEEIIWDCSYWAAGMDEFTAYRPCVNKHGDVRRKIDPTVAHRNHLHLGLSKAGATKHSSFWDPAGHPIWDPTAPAIEDPNAADDEDPWPADDDPFGNEDDDPVDPGDDADDPGFA